MGTASATFSARHARARAVIRSALESHFGLDNPGWLALERARPPSRSPRRSICIPTVHNGQLLEGPDAIEAAESFRPTPTTTRARRATARCTTYGQGRAGPFRGAPRPGPPDDAADRQNSVEATAPPRDTGGKRVAPVTPPVDALPVRPAAPQTPIAPAAPPVQTTAISAHATAGQRAATARRREPGQHDDAGFCAATGRSDVEG